MNEEKINDKSKQIYQYDHLSLSRRRPLSYRNQKPLSYRNLVSI